MDKTFRENPFYFFLMGAFVLVGGIFLVLFDKSAAIYFFSENRSSLLDQAARFITRLGEEPMYFLLGVAVLAIRVRYTLLVAVTGITVMGFSYSLKAFFAVDRPAAFFAKQNLAEKLNFVQGVDLHTGATSFPSGHAMSAFALYSLLIFLLPSHKRYTIPLFAVALLVALSRVYLVQHFWPDVYVGAIIGAALAMVIYSWLGGPEEVR